MSETAPSPVEIRYHSRSRVLEVSFTDGARFELAAGYLRCFARAADQGEELSEAIVPPTDLPPVGIVRIVPLDGGAIGLHFDDGHESGVYTWAWLYRLGREQAKRLDRHIAPIVPPAPV